MNLSIETLVTVLIAVLVAGIIGISVFGQSTDFIDWSDNTSEGANCDLVETQFSVHAECDGGNLDYNADEWDDRLDECGLNPNDVVEC